MNHYITIVAIFAAISTTGPVSGQRTFSVTEDSFLPMSMDDGAQVIGKPAAATEPRVTSQERTPSVPELPEIPGNVEIESTTQTPDLSEDAFLRDGPNERRAGNAKAIFNAFIATIAPESAWLKTNITRDVSEIPPGYQEGYSKNLGRFAYRPRTWDSLTKPQQERILKDPRLKAFIISMRDPSNQPKVEFDYGRSEKGEVYVDGYLKSEIESMKQLVESLRREQRDLVGEMTKVMEDLRSNVSSIKEEQAIIVENLNDSVIALQADQTNAVEKLNLAVEDLRKSQGIIMGELNESVAIAMQEHQKIIDLLREQNADFSEEWKTIREEVLEMMSQATPIEVIKQSAVSKAGYAQKSPSVSGMQPTQWINPLAQEIGELRAAGEPAPRLLKGEVSPDLSEEKANPRIVSSGGRAKTRTDSVSNPRFSFLMPEDYQNNRYIIKIDGQALIRGQIQ